MITVKNVHKSFGSLEVLRGVDLQVEKGEVIAILGPSGSGKTTLLRCINFLETADQGELIFDGEQFDLHRISKRDIARLRKKTAFVFQNYNLFLNKTALQNVTEGLVVARKMPKAQAVEIAKKALDKVGLSDRCDHYPNQLSGGQQQRVAIARAIVGNPKLLLADEPTGALDTASGVQIMDIFRRLSQRGITIIMITHELGIAQCADKIYHILDGRLHTNGVPQYTPKEEAHEEA